MISQLFENVKVYGRYVRENKLDGLEYWNRIKLFIKKPEQKVGLNKLNEIIGCNWTIKVMLDSDSATKSSNLDQIYEFVHGENQLQIYGEEGDENKHNMTHEKWEKNHFFLQLIRIAKNNSLDLVRLLQVAYNLGQLSICLNKKNFSAKAIGYFKSNNLDNLDSYIKLTQIQNKQISSNTQIQDLITNTILFIVEQMNLTQSGGGFDMEPFYSENVEELTGNNNDYRRVLYTGKNQQFVLMSIKPNDSVPMEIHENHDQFIKIVQGVGICVVNKFEYNLNKDSVLVIPAGSSHQINNTGSDPLKLYTIYSPPKHPDKLIEESNPNPNESVEESYPDNNKFMKKYIHYKNKYVQLKKFIDKYYLINK
jgi:mannose-6-phosphate isomerase-like protein (cupin superfamily)